MKHIVQVIFHISRLYKLKCLTIASPLSCHSSMHYIMHFLINISAIFNKIHPTCNMLCFNYYKYLKWKKSNPAFENAYYKKCELQSTSGKCITKHLIKMLAA